MGLYQYSPGVRNSPVYPTGPPRKRKVAPLPFGGGATSSRPPGSHPLGPVDAPFSFTPQTPTADPTPPPAPAPDWTTLIENDPTLVALKAMLSGQDVADKASRDAAIKRAYIQFGGHPDLGALGLGDLSGVIDPTTQSLADDATRGKVSTTYRLGAVHDTSEAQIRNAMAARGLAHSGELGTQFQHEETAYGQANYDANQKFLDYVGGIGAGYAANKRAREMQLIQGQGDAASRQASYPWNQTGDATPQLPAAPPPGQIPTSLLPPAQRARKRAKPRYGTGTQIGAL